MTFKVSRMSVNQSIRLNFSKILRCTGSWGTQILKILIAQKNSENVPVERYHSMRKRFSHAPSDS